MGPERGHPEDYRDTDHRLVASEGGVVAAELPLRPFRYLFAIFAVKVFDVDLIEKILNRQVRKEIPQRTQRSA